MAVLDKLFTSFLKAGKGASKAAANAAAKEAGAIAKGAKAAAKATPKAAGKIVGKIAQGAAKPSAVNTATKMYTKSAGRTILKKSAQSLANSKIVKTTAKIGAGATIIGGSTYALGKFGGKGLSELGYGLRGLTNNHTPQENVALDVRNAADAADVADQNADRLVNFYSWLNDNGLSDSPYHREAYDNYVQGNDDGVSPLGNVTGSNTWKVALLVGAAALGVYAIKKKKVISKIKKGFKK